MRNKDSGIVTLWTVTLMTVEGEEFSYDVGLKGSVVMLLDQGGWVPLSEAGCSKENRKRIIKSFVTNSLLKVG